MSDTPAPRKNYTASWMVLVGVVLALVGGIGLNGARLNRERAERIGEFSRAMGGRPSEAVEQATALGHLWLGVLIVGLAVTLAGVVVIALRAERRPVQ